jgi:hypothetical protein
MKRKIMNWTLLDAVLIMTAIFTVAGLLWILGER